MILLLPDVGAVPLSRLTWEKPPPVPVSGSDAWLRASRRQVEDVRDDQGHPFPLRQELWLTVCPPRDTHLWRVEAESIALGVVGRGVTSEVAVHDWRRRFRAVAQRFIEMRPFEMTEEDRETWRWLQSVIDVTLYKATKPMVIRQIGKVEQARPGRVVVQWEDGAGEKVVPDVFDEVFSRFRVGQRFEATVTRHPVTFRIIRAEAVRKLPRQEVSADLSQAIWEGAVGKEFDGKDAAPTSPEIDEGFWLQPPTG